MSPDVAIAIALAGLVVAIGLAGAAIALRVRRAETAETGGPR